LGISFGSYGEKSLGMAFGSYGEKSWEWYLAVMVKRFWNNIWQLWRKEMGMAFSSYGKNRW
jgi:hypothetical protein